MKKIILFVIMMMVSFYVHAQLEVDSLGNVKTYKEFSNSKKISISSPQRECLLISRTPGDSLFSNYNINSTVYQNTFCNPNRIYCTYNIYSKTKGLSTTNKGYCVGVYSEVSGNGSKKSAIHGMISGYGIAVYGGTAPLPPTISNKTYAGYFGGATHVEGNLTVSGTIDGTVLSKSANPSADLAMTVEMSKQESSLLPLKLQNLNAQTFYYAVKQKVLNDNEDEEETLDGASSEEQSIAEKQIYSKQHYGFDADQLEEVFPDLVYENEDGTKSINYVEMVPILVQAINELKSELDELKGNGAAKKGQTRAASADEMGDNLVMLSLGQNKPNPFGTTTSIEVSIPNEVQKAFIYVYDLQGKKVDQVDITARGKQTVLLNAAALTDGMYLYSLIADGKVVETRRMIVEK